MAKEKEGIRAKELAKRMSTDFEITRHSSDFPSHSVQRAPSSPLPSFLSFARPEKMTWRMSSRELRLSSLSRPENPTPKQTKDTRQRRLPESRPFGR